MLFKVPALDPQDLRVLGEIDDFYANFTRSTGGSAPREWLGGVRKRAVAGAIRGSNSIEGYTVDLTQASAILDGATVPASVPEDTREAVTGYRDALTWVLRTPEMGYFTHGETVISLLHFMMMRFFKGKSPGLYRRTGIVVTGNDPLAPAYVGPPAEQVHTLMAELVEWLNAGDLDAHPLIRASMAHLNLVSIHPWPDGNGRMSRCLHTLVLALAGRTHPEFSSIEEWLGNQLNTLAYYEALQFRRRFEPSADAHEWIRFCLRAHHEQAQIVDRRLKLGAAMWHAIVDLVARLGLHTRTTSALYDAATDQLRRDHYQETEGVSRDQSIRDIRKLEQAGLVTSVGYGATLHYIAAGELKEILQREMAALTAPLVPPYR
jgi:Fic family protein